MIDLSSVPFDPSAILLEPDLIKAIDRYGTFGRKTNNATASREGRKSTRPNHSLSLIMMLQVRHSSDTAP